MLTGSEWKATVPLSSRGTGCGTDYTGRYRLSEHHNPDVFAAPGYFGETRISFPYFATHTIRQLLTIWFLKLNKPNPTDWAGQASVCPGSSRPQHKDRGIVNMLHEPR